MKIINIYKCEHCGFETRNFEDIEKHEAAHFGLSVKDKHKYDAMLSYLYFVNSLPDNDKVKESRIATQNKLIRFERCHGLIRNKVKFATINTPNLYKSASHDNI